jgi:hypothetical protein
VLDSRFRGNERQNQLTEPLAPIRVLAKDWPRGYQEAEIPENSPQ